MPRTPRRWAARAMARARLVQLDYEEQQILESFPDLARHDWSRGCATSARPRGATLLVITRARLERVH